MKSVSAARHGKASPILIAWSAVEPRVGQIDFGLSVHQADTNFENKIPSGLGRHNFSGSSCEHSNGCLPLCT